MLGRISRVYTPNLYLLLKEYAHLKTPLKKTGLPLPFLHVTNVDPKCTQAYVVADELFTVTGELRMLDRLWDLEANRRAHRKHRKQI